MSARRLQANADSGFADGAATDPFLDDAFAGETCAIKHVADSAITAAIRVISFMAFSVSEFASLGTLRLKADLKASGIFVNFVSGRNEFFQGIPDPVL